MLSLSLTYGSCDDSLFFATFGEIKNGKEKKKSALTVGLFHAF